MDEDEHEVYGGEIPDEADMDADVDMSRSDEDASKELEEMKRRLKEMEEEAAALRDMHAKVEKEMGSGQDPNGAAANQSNKEEADARSIYVGNPKGFAYVEFLEAEAVQEALQLNDSELHGRQLRVQAKRTNVPGLKQFRPGRYNPYMAYPYSRPYMPPYYASPYGYGRFPRFRRPMRYRPYF